MAKQKIPAQKPPDIKPLINTVWYEQPNMQALLLSVLAILLYAVTFQNEWALDDVISITMNSFTQKGFAGIPDLLSKDSFYGFVGNASDLTGGRWRPLALVSFATEIQLFGWKKISPADNLTLAHVMHFDNVLLYSAIAFLLYKLLFNHITKNIWSAFIITLLFVVHPIHSEVVANIKSRDELLSCFFLLLTLNFSLDWKKKNKIIFMFLSAISFFLALTSKENGVTFIAILPVTFFCFAKLDWKKSFLATLPFVFITVFYIVLRFSIIGFVNKEITEVMNAPFLYATPLQAFATKMFVLGKYIVMLFFPVTLNYDYSYNQIPYTDFGDWRVLLSIIVQLALLIYAFMQISKRNLIAYGILFYFFSVFIVSNLVVDTGGVMGERFLFQASFGFLIAIVSVLSLLIQKIKLDEKVLKPIMIGLFIIIILPASYKTYSRSQEWKNDKILFIKDVATNPNSARTNNGGGTSYIFLGDDAKDSTQKKLCYDSAVILLKTASRIHPKYADPYLNLGVAYNRKKMIDSAEYFWNKARALQPDHPKLGEFDKVLVSEFLSDAGKFYQKGDTARAINDYRKAVQYGPGDSKTWYNLAGIYFTVHRYDSARICFEQTLKINPKEQQAQQALNFMNRMRK